MERQPIPVRIGEQATTPGGELIRVDFVNRNVVRRDRATVEDVHDHEANHAGVALATGSDVIHLNTIRSGNVLGFVQTNEANLLAAAVTMGRPGAGSDEFKTRLMGGNESTASLARGIASSVEDGIDEIARAAAAEGQLSGSEVREAFEDGLKGREVIIFSQAADGRKKKERTRVKGQIAEVIPLFPGVPEEIGVAA
ncbi:MAG: hypothetical protein KBD51_03590 [Candidatus Levybacteria bacterium]|nr:hypothetical protein [Candidatus Levybacteria bacterium]